MKVLLVSNTLPPHDLSGAGEQVVQLARGLEELGVEVRILGRGPGGARGPKSLFPLTVLLPALREVRRWRPDVVQVHESDGGLLAALLRLRRRRPRLVALQQVSYREERRSVRPLVDRGREGAPVVARPTRAELRFRRWRTPVQIALGILSARCADHVLVPSRATGEELVRDYGVESFGVLPNVTGSGPTAEPDEAARDYLLYVGRLRQRKGLEILLHALAAMAREGPVPRLVVVGDGERFECCRRLARDLGLSERVDFEGRGDRPAVQAWLGRARALVVPSIYEGMPLVILEAMASAVPVVASSVSGIPEVVIAGETGWLVEPEDSGLLAQALSECWREPDTARRRGRAGRRRLLDRYLPEHGASRWLDLVDAGSGERRSSDGTVEG